MQVKLRLYYLNLETRKSLSSLIFVSVVKNLRQSSQVRYLGVILQDHLHWDTHLRNLEKKLSLSIGLLSKIRYYVPMHLLRTIYYSIFNSHLIYACEMWGQNQNNLRFMKLTKLQNKVLKTSINFSHLIQQLVLFTKKTKF